MRAFIKMESEEYHKHRAIGSSTLKLGLESMAKLKAKIDGRIKDKTSEAFELGTAAHSAILELDFTRYICGPEVDKRSKAWKEFEEENLGKICLKESQYLQIKGMHDAFYAHNLASRIVSNGVPEASFFVDILGQQYKARPDWLKIETEGREEKDAYIVDYKTCEQLDYDTCQRAIANYGYDMSAAHYIQVVSASAEIAITEYYWIFQEKTAPYELGIFRMDDECKARAMATVSRLYERVSQANKSGLWPTKFKSEIYDIDIPHYLTHKRPAL